MSEHRITGTGRLLDEEGRLREPGWATRPPFAYDHADIQAPPWRIKDWDYYLVAHLQDHLGDGTAAAGFHGAARQL